MVVQDYQGPCAWDELLEETNAIQDLEGLGRQAAGWTRRAGGYPAPAASPPIVASATAASTITS